MNTTHNNDTYTNLSQPLQSAVFIPRDETKKRTLSAGNRWCKLIKKGEPSKLAASIAVEVPASINIPSYLGQPIISEAVVEYIQSLQDAYIKSLAVSGAKQIQYSDLNEVKLAEFLATSDDSGRIGQLSGERIAAWFEADMREMLIVALADRLGLSDTATEQDVKRLEQIANQTRDNLAKLSSKKPVHFDKRVKDALNWALDSTSVDDDAMFSRLKDKLNAADMMPTDEYLSALGF